MSDDAKVDSMEEPEEVTELNEEELEGVAGGMFPVSTTTGGSTIPTAPNICKVPDVIAVPGPIPYPNIGTSSDGTTSTKTKTATKSDSTESG